MGSKIAYYNFLQYAALTVTSQATGFPKANLQDFRDYTYWKATGTGDQTIEIDLNGSGYEASYVGYIGFVGHNLKTADAAIQLQKWNGTEWEVVLSDFASPYRDWETDRKSTRLNSSHSGESRMPSSA